MDYAAQELAELDLRPRALRPARFDVADVTAWRRHLDERGYVVLRDVASAADCAAGDALFWAWVEAAAARSPIVRSTGGASVRRDDPATWTEYHGWPQESLREGLLHKGGVGQSAWLWWARGLPGVRAAFAAVWGTDRLHTSFTGGTAMRPAGDGPGRTPHRTAQQWYHKDQGLLAQGRQCVQGLLNLREGGPGQAGLVVVPGSHTDHAAMRDRVARRCPSFLIEGNDAGFLPLDLPELGTSELRRIEGRAVKLDLSAGDLALWDSRTVHCNQPPERGAPVPARACGGAGDLARLGCFVCMAPAAGTPPEAAAARARAVAAGVTLRHNPNTCDPLSGECREQPAPRLTPLLRRLASIDPYPDPAVLVAERSAAGAAALRVFAGAARPPHARARCPAAAAGGWRRPPP